jgi:hypothetical protein
MADAITWSDLDHGAPIGTRVVHQSQLRAHLGPKGRGALTKSALVDRDDSSGRSRPRQSDVHRLDSWCRSELSGISTDITAAKQALEHAFTEIRVLKDRLRQENIALREEVDKPSMFEEIVGTSPELRAVLSHIAKVAPTDSRHRRLLAHRRCGWLCLDASRRSRHIRRRFVRAGTEAGLCDAYCARCRPVRSEG